MNKQTEALRMAKQHIIERKGGRGGAVCYVKSDEEVIKAIDEALAQPAQICEVCGSTMTDEELAERKKTNPKLISCCPDRKMLEQPAQEPVAWVGSLNEFDMRRLLNEGYELSTALYTHPAPSWVGLTSEEIRSLDLDNDVISVIFQTEKLLKEKNHG